MLHVSGRGAARLFAGEAGGHRWQRVPPNERRGRVHTSTITIAVLAEPREHELVLRADELEIERTGARGSGGQHLQKTESAVRIRHLPTGIEVRCETERSQHANRETAMAILRARVLAAQRTAIATARAADRKQQIGSGQRGDKRRTIRTQDDRVTDHVDGRTWLYKRYVRGDWA
ncbi:MAG TPA: peptide chain release factor-like protein [Paraburkholderia sp.]